MGGGGTSPSGDEFGKWKTRAGWFDVGTELINVTANSGTYRLHATDDGGSIVSGRHYGLRIRRNDIQDYWIDYRARTNDAYLDNGAVFVTSNFSDAASKLGFTSAPRALDLTPESIPGAYQDGDGTDGTLLVGRTYSDFDAQLHFTVVARHEEAGNNYLDIEINKGSLPGNNGPVTTLAADIVNATIGQTISFTGTASDADNDPLSTFWDFGDKSFTANTLAPTHSYSAAGEYVVSFEASDRKGGSATRKVVIKVAAPTLQGVHEGAATLNTYTTSDQNEPAIASNGYDKFVAVWTSSGQDGASNGVYGQRLDANGVAAGSEFQVSTTTAGSQATSDVAMAADGSFIVVWEGQGASGQDDHGIFAQRFNANGTAAGSEFPINNDAYAFQIRPQVKMNKATGDFVVVWSTNIGGTAVRMRRFSANGTALDANDVSLPGGRHFSDVDVAIASDGKFVVVWDNDTHSEGGTDTSGFGVFGQRYNANGTTAGSAFQVNSTETNSQQRPRVEYDSTGKFTVVWQSYGQENNDGAVIMRTFNGDGTAFSNEVVVNSTTSGEQHFPELTIDSSDRRLVAWRNYGGGFSGVDFAARFMSADGSALSNEFSRDVSTNFFEGPDIAVAGSQIVVVNPERNSAVGVDVRAHRFKLATIPTAVADSAKTGMGKAVTINALANDSNAGGGSLTLSIPRPPQHGSAMINNNATPSDPSDDRIVFTPDSRFIGTETFSYTLTNAAGASAAGLVAVTIDGTGNRPPNDLALSTLAVSQSSTAGVPLATISGSDPNSDALTYSLVNDAGGRFTISGNWLLSTSTPLNVSDISQRITVRATDPSGATYDEQFRVFIIDTPVDGSIANNAIDSPIGSQIHGEITGDYSGRSLRVIGDINGDGYDDIAIGARDVDVSGLTDAGKAYVVFGSANGIANPLSLANLDGTTGFTISGLATNDQLGRGLAGGDVNGDELADLIVSAPGTTNGAGKVFVIFGKTTAFSATFDTSTLNGSNGVTIQSLPGNSGPLGQDVAAGDINADGLQDVVIRSSGDVYVVFGQTTFSGATVTSLGSGAAGIRFDNTNVDNIGEPADVNGDGYDDLLLGNISATGEAWVFFGAASFPSETPTFNFSTPSTSAGFRMTATGSTRFGTIGSVGDVNGDGFADVGVGDYSAGSSKGRSYVLFGSATPAASNIDLSTLNGTTGFSFTNTSGPAASLGETVGTAGDFNGDGFDDVMIGGTDTVYDQRVAVLFGGSSFSSSIDLSALNGSNGFFIDGGSFYGNFGCALGAGDINGDGFDDAVNGARTEDGNGQHDSGITYVLYGNDFKGDRVTHLGDANANSLTGTSGANAVVAGQANDTVTGAGGADSFRGGQGDDQFEIADVAFQRIVGGTGSDTVRLNNAGGLSLNLSTLKDNRMLGIEQIDLRSGGADTLTLTARDVLNLSDSSNTLLVQRGSYDTVNKGSGWTTQANEVMGGLTYNVFTQGNATLKVQEPTVDQNLVVTTLTDEDNGSANPLLGTGVSLREALSIANANPGPATITFADGLTGTLRLNGSEITIASEVTIVGPGSAVISINADSNNDDSGDSRIFNIDDGSSGTQSVVAISGLTLTRGSAANDTGGAIRNLEDLTLSNVTISNSIATGSGEGGGIYNEEHLIISNGKLLSNSGNNGGALSNVGATATAEISLSLIDSNSATLAGAGLYSFNGILQLADLTLQNNHTLHGSGVLGIAGAQVTIDRTSFVDNIADTDGAGLYLYSASGSIRDSVFTRNDAIGTGPGVAGGGAIKNDQDSVLVIERSSFNDNSSTVGGGIENYNSTLTVINSTFFDNSATGAGGAIHMVGGTVLSRSNTFTQNSASSGGAISPSGTFSSANTIFENNSATIGPDISGALNSLGHNFISSVAGMSGNISSDKTGAGARLGGVQVFSNGTSGFPLLSSSLAIDAGSNTEAVDATGAALATDQRGAGFARIVDGNSDTTVTVDIGAVEFNSVLSDTVTVKLAPTSATEDGANDLVFTFERGSSSGSLTVNFNVSGTAVFGTDYTQTGADSFSTTAGSVTFADGVLSIMVVVVPAIDSTPELDETVVLTLVTDAGYTAGSPGTQTGTILNDDGATTVYVDDDWAGLAIGVDPDGAGPATAIGVDAFATIQAGVNAVASIGTVNVYAGLYAENVSITKSVSVVGVTGAATGGEPDVVIIDPVGGTGISIDSPASIVGLTNLTVTGATNGVSAAGAVALTLTNMQLTNHTSSGLTSTSSGDMTLNGGTYDGINVSNADDVIIGTSGFIATDNIVIGAQNSLTINGAVAAGSSTVTLAANSDHAGSDSFLMSATGSITTTNDTASAVTITVNSLLGGTGNATITSISAGTTSGVVTINAYAGAVIDGNSASTNITAFGAEISGSGGVGSASNAIETSVARLEGAGGSGGIYVVDSDDLTLGGVSATVGLTATSGDIDVRTDGGALIVSENVTASSGDISLTAAAGATQELDVAGQDLTVSNSAAIRTTTGDVILEAADNITLQSGSIISAAKGSVEVLGDQDGELDPNTGAVITVASQVVSQTGTTLSGGLSSDSYLFSYPTNGQNSGTITISDEAGSNDTLAINGTSGADSFFLTNVSAGYQVGLGTVAGQPVVIDGGIESVSLLSGSGGDTVSVEPTTLFPLTLDGGDPTAAPGDTLTLNALGQAYQVQGGNTVVFTGPEGSRSIQFFNFESANLNGGGGGGDEGSTLSFDFNGRSVVNGEYVQSPTQAGFTGVTADTTYNATRGYGWNVPLVAVTGGSSTSSIAALINDAHVYTTATSSDLPTFRANVPNGPTTVNVVIGHPTLAMDGIRLRNADNGDFIVENLATEAGESLSYTFTVNVTDGTLDLRFEDVLRSRMIAINGLAIVSGNASPLVITNLPNTSLPADGLSSDTFLMSGGTPNSLVTIATSLGTLIGTDADSHLQGFQVATDSSGGASIVIQRPSLIGTATITMSSVIGGATGTAAVSYSQPAVKKYDFDAFPTNTQAGYVSVLTSSLYSSAIGYGWLAAPNNFRVTTPTESTLASLVNDGHRGSTPGTFRVNLENGTYDVHLSMGDRADHSGLNVAANGVVAIANQSLSRDTVFEKSFTTTVTNGVLDLTLSQSGATVLDPYWVLNGLEIRPSASVGTISPTNVGSVPADGSTMTAVNATSSLAMGTVVTVSSTLGTITTSDADSRVAGTQVVVGAGGAITFSLRSPSMAGTPTVEWRTLDGSHRKTVTDSAFLAFNNAASRYFDFNRGFNDASMSATAPGYVGVRTNHNPSLDGFGWTSAPTAFTSPGDPPNVTPTALYQDGHMGAPGEAREFRFSATSGASYSLVAYVGRYGLALDQVRITAEGATARIAPSTNWDQFTTVAITGALDVNHDGFISVTFEDSTTRIDATRGGLLTGWAVVGLDVLESAENLQAAFEASSEGSSSVRHLLSSDEADTYLALAKTFIAATTPNLSAADRATLNAVTVKIVDLSGTGLLGMTNGRQIYLDDNGAGLGWSLADGKQTNATEYDLFTALAHELGHTIGHPHTDSGLMLPTLTPGLRAQAIDDFFANFEG